MEILHNEKIEEELIKKRYLEVTTQEELNDVLTRRARDDEFISLDFIQINPSKPNTPFIIQDSIIPIVVLNGKLEAFGRSIVKALNDSYCLIYDKAIATFYHKSRGELHNRAKGYFKHYSTAICYDESVANLSDKVAGSFLNNSSAQIHDASMGTFFHHSKGVLYDNSNCTAFGTSEVTLYNRTNATLKDKSHGFLYNNSHAQLYDTSSAGLHDSSIAIQYNYSFTELFEESKAILNFCSITKLRSNRAKALLKDYATALNECGEEAIIYKKNHSRTISVSELCQTTEEIKT